MTLRILDGPMGTELERRGCDLPEGPWSALCNQHAPGEVRAVHAEYAAAGADVHTANTFRTQPRALGEHWRELLDCAVRLGREALGDKAVLAGSMAPLEDCYRPDLSPVNAREEHQLMASALKEAGVDLLLCETFPHVGEALVAVEEASRTGLETWVAFTGGPDGTLLSPNRVGEAGKLAVDRGAAAVLVNCVAPELVLPYVEALGDLGVPVGAYGNASQTSSPEYGVSSTDENVRRYVRYAEQWVEAGASIVGSCCGTGTRYVAALNETLRGGSR